MTIRDGFFAIIALGLSSAALAGMVYTDAYSQAAQAEAAGYDALSHQLSNDQTLLCANLPARLMSAPSDPVPR